MASSKKQSDEAVAPEVTDEQTTPETTETTDESQDAPQNDEKAPETPEETEGAPEDQEDAEEAVEPSQSVSDLDDEERAAWILANTSSATREHIEQELAAGGESPTLNGLLDNN